MFNITLLSSFHKIHGKCNPHELYKIIQEIEPEIIFEELSNVGFDIIYSAGYQPQTVEAITITHYLRTHSIKHFPVDNYPIKETELLSDAQIIWDTSSEYRDLWNQKLLRVNQDGYVFLNSNECTAMLDRISTIEEAVLTEINDLKLLNQHKAEKILHDKREYVMLSNIYNISKQYPFERALFICGAEHRLPFRKKIKEFISKETLKLEWTFYNDN
ncbi:hypothetical protein H7F15_01530 [Pontibacter sp. Tf4]|uniref:hypothetical protein n=1 Tax=Pontibacter sp. Tf4 TaxID=2761620 RepID=UPI00162326FE|nr:hypothetical protein [Pontibacter sp. Tf4]MBB6609706.1 hypothetical protein [Pontibacter sp. Tf4]